MYTGIIYFHQNSLSFIRTIYSTQHILYYKEIKENRMNRLTVPLLPKLFDCCFDRSIDFP